MNQRLHFFGSISNFTRTSTTTTAQAAHSACSIHKRNTLARVPGVTVRDDTDTRQNLAPKYEARYLNEVVKRTENVSL